MLGHAIAKAARAHAGQKDLSGAAYITHPIRVMITLAVDGHDEVTLAAAVLHDTKEDCGVSLVELADEFGIEVAEAVDAVSHRKALGETYFEFIARAAVHPRGRVIKVADIRDNMRPGAPESLYERYRVALRLLGEGEPS